MQMSKQRDEAIVSLRRISFPSNNLRSCTINNFENLIKRLISIISKHKISDNVQTYFMQNFHKSFFVKM